MLEGREVLLGLLHTCGFIGGFMDYFLTREGL
jgi:hypothetical protein